MRTWQRIGSGRLAKDLGGNDAAVETDRRDFLRTEPERQHGNGRNRRHVRFCKPGLRMTFAWGRE